MKNFPYKILFACIFLPPVFYIFTINGLEAYFQKQLTDEINSILIRNTTELFEGRYSVREEINRNLGDFLAAQEFKYKMGISINVLVRTKNGTVLYPSQYDSYAGETGTADQTDSSNYMEVAEENYRILNERLLLSATITLRHNSWISNSILVFYILIALFIIRFFVKKSIADAERIEEQQAMALKELTEKLTFSEEEIEKIKSKEEQYRNKIQELNKEKDSLSTDVDELLEEMENLEKGLNEQKELREKRESDITLLKNEIDDLKVKTEKPKKRSKKNEMAAKRLKTLYKNLIFTEKAIDGFVSLSEEFQLKAEEIIHRINADDSTVNVRRKVFSKGGKINVLEVDFAYSGRIYFQKDSETQKKIVVIGTKKTQNQDLGYLHREYKV